MPPLRLRRWVTMVDLGAGLTEYRCSAPVHATHYVWTRLRTRFAPLPADSSEGSGLAAELGMYETLPELIAGDEPWIEYGILERRFREEHPGAFAAVLDRYPHREHGHHGYTASMYIAMILGALRDRGSVMSMGKPGPATGYWSYNGSVHYWARPPGPPTDDMLTYAEWAQSTGRDPQRP